MNGALLSIILALAIYAVALLLWSGKRRKVVVQQQEIPLGELARLWAASRRSGQIHIKDLAPLWRKSVINTAERSTYRFKYTGVQQWFDAYIVSEPWFDQAEAHQEICYQILRMLEEEDPCPSVVNPANDVEASWDSNTYTLLGRTSLLDHSLHVGEQIVSLLIEGEAQHVIPDAMIAALAHDLGKLPSNRPHLYSLGEHPLAAGRVLAEIGLFKQLARKEEISKAIKQHHMKADGLIGKMLKKADQKARQQELDEGVAVAGPDREEQGRAASAQAIEEVLHESPTSHVGQPEKMGPPVSQPGQRSMSQNGLARRADADIYGDGERERAASGGNGPMRQQINISSWFDGQAFLEALKPSINLVQGRRFKAFSMPDGYVYVQPKLMEEVARGQAEKAGAMDIATMAEKDKTMQRVLLAIVDHFRNEGLIAPGLIKERYFGGYFTIHLKGGKAAMKGYYTPFLAEAFGALAEMEGEKKGLIKNFSSVEIFQGQG